MADLQTWSVVDANNNAAPPDGWPENTMQYSEVNNTGRAVQGTVRRFYGDINGSLVAAGIVNAYTLTLNAPYAAYFTGLFFACRIPVSNTGAVTLNVNGIGAQSVVNSGGAPLTAGELQANGLYEFRFDGVNFQLGGTARQSTILTPPALAAGPTNNWNPGITDLTGRVRVTGDAAGSELTGLVASADGKRFVLTNVSANSITLRDESVSSLAANRFAMNGDMLLTAGTSAEFLYDDLLARWTKIGA